MKREDLFLAIGQVEASRLERSEWTVSSPSGKEDKTMKAKPKRVIRNLLVAAVIVSMLAVTAYAVTGFLIFDSPEDMIATIFGDQTGFDHSEGGPKYYEDGGLAAMTPTFDRAPADETVVEEDIAPYIAPVGQTINWNGYTLTVDAFMYDSTTKCGFFTYLLENPAGLPDYQLQTTGEIWYEGVPDIISVNQYGYPYIIQDKTTDTCLAATFYFQWDARREENLEIKLRSTVRYTPDEFAAFIAEDIARLKQEMTPEEAVAAEKKIIGDEAFAIAFQGLTEEEIAEQCYADIAGRTAAERLEQENESEAIIVPLNNGQKLSSVRAGEGSAIITPISMHIDISNLTFLHTDSQGLHRVSTDNVESLVIRFDDGTEYTVFDGYTLNYAFCLSQYPEENVQTQVFVTPEEDPYGEGYVYVENSHDYCLLTTMFNRIIDVDQISTILINGVELPVD